MRRVVNRFPRGVWLFALALALVTSLPYIMGALRTPPGWEYTGAAALPTGTQVDYNSHMAKMWQGSRGEWAYHLLFTSEPHPGIFGLQGFYVLLGALSPVKSLAGFALTYHVARFLLTAAMTLAIWRFACRFFERGRERWLCLLFATLVGGWSWWLLFTAPEMTAQISPIEFWLTDAYNLLGALYMPHFAAAVILQIVIMLAFDSWAREGGQQHRHLVILTLALAADSIIQPYAALLFGPLLVILAGQHVQVAKRLSLRRTLWLALPLGVYGLLTAYQFLATQSDPVWLSFSQQNQTLSPPVVYYALGFAPLLLPIVLGARTFLLDQSDDKWLLPLLWAFLAGMLLFAPLPTQRRYLLGVQTPLAIMAVYGWTRAVLPMLRPRLRPMLTTLYITLAAAALFGMIFMNTIAFLIEPRDQPDDARWDAYIQGETGRGYEWLRENAPADSVILTTMRADGRGSGGQLVAATGLRVYIGHWFETADFTGKLAAVQQFYDVDTSDAWREEFLREAGIDFVWWDGWADDLGDWNPFTAPFLQQEHASVSVAVFRVVGDDAS